MKTLSKIKNYLKDNQIISTSEYLQDEENRYSLYNDNPESFLAETSKGLPVIPIVDLNGNVSYPVMMKSLLAVNKKLREFPENMELLRTRSYLEEVLNPINKQNSRYDTLNYFFQENKS